jgi:hypothetical protein
MNWKHINGHPVPIKSEAEKDVHRVNKFHAEQVILQSQSQSQKGGSHAAKSSTVRRHQQD